MVSPSSVKIDSLLAFFATALVASAQQGWNAHAYPQAAIASQAPWGLNAWYPPAAAANGMWAGYGQPMMRGKALVAADADGDYNTYTSEPSVEPTDSVEPTSESNGDGYNGDEVLPTSETNRPVYSGSVAESSEYSSKCETAAPTTVTATATATVTNTATVTQAPLPAVTVTETSILTITNVITQTVAPSSEHPGYTSSYGSVEPTSEQPSPVYPTVAPSYSSVQPTSEKPSPVYPTVAPSYGSVQPTSEQPAPVYPVYSPSYGSVAPSSEAPAPVYPPVAPSYGAVQPTSEQPAPVYSTVAPSYGVVQPSSEQPAPVYPTVAPSYGVVQPTSEHPAPAYPIVAPAPAPAPAPAYGAPAPAYGAVQPTSEQPGYGNVAPEKPQPPVYHGAAPSDEQPAPYAPPYKPAPPPAYGHPEPTTFVTVTETPVSTSTQFVDTTSEIIVTQTASPDRDHHGKPKKHGSVKPQNAPHVARAGVVAPNQFLNPVMPENPWIKPVPKQAAQRWGASITGTGQMISGTGSHANVRVSDNEKHQPAPRKFMEDIGFYLRHGAAHNGAH
ncbi:hypothetical protein H4R99_004527 [Coemansia sp. RSA 1722]|nr:hypothetical protein LPJ57_005050 [Coemansia sp. RSA 486]KAJ2234756.1 hypothetical protein IWW45_003155 [Coemansia sp. RSA 485]KAJ2596836.1 hypothetical protein GGF39_003288 [Coemansia sp. RSA 1721]KAJ2597395.1 hypothetical protein H4R99_004527 [Coemansia sp. RSA 1722]